MANAMRHNEGKPELEYIDTWYHALCEVAKVCQAGAEKYAVGNYLLGQDYRQLIGAARRHIGKFSHYQMEDYDEESNCHHIAHAIWNLLQLLQLEVGPPISQQGESNQAMFDNRIRPPVEASTEGPPSTVLAAYKKRKVDTTAAMRGHLQQSIGPGLAEHNIELQQLKVEIKDLLREGAREASMYRGVQNES